MGLELPNLLFDTKEMSDFKIFRFKNFEVNQLDTVFKVGTDAFVLGSWIECAHAPDFILDIGTGTGVLSLMMAQKFPNSTITAIDNNSDAVHLARLNFSSNKMGEKCAAKQLNFHELNETFKYNLIVSNPPYFLDSSAPNNDVLGLAKHLSTKDLQDFFVKSSRLLEPKGTLCMIFPNDPRFIEFAKAVNLFPKRILSVFGKSKALKRLCVEFCLTDTEPILETLTIRDETGRYSVAYKQLTKEFHGTSLE